MTDLYISVGIDVGNDFSYMSIALPIRRTARLVKPMMKSSIISCSLLQKLHKYSAIAAE